MSVSRFLFLLVLLHLSPVAAAAGDSWGVVLLSVPPAISPSEAGVNTAFYILKQTHEPLFRKDDGSNYSSRLLSTWSRSIQLNEYAFCPRAGLFFDSQKQFTIEDLFVHLKKVNNSFDAKAVVTKSSTCVRVEFPVQRKLYLDYLSRYENAPSAPSQSRGDENGLGPYFILEHTKSKMTLARKQAISNGYNHIVVYGYSGLSGIKNSEAEITDFNRISPSDVPKAVPSRSQSFSNAVLKSFNLVINHPDKNIREAVYNCVDIEKLRRAYLPEQREFIDIKTILPLGVAGAEAGRPAQSCVKFKGIGDVKPLIFANWRNDNAAQMKLFSQQFYVTTGIPLKILKVTPEEFSKGVLGVGHPFNLEVLVLDAVSPEYSAFFDYLCRPYGLLNYLIPKAEALYRMLLMEEDEERRINTARNISMGISSSRAVLPLFQEIRRFYYPKVINNITVGRGFLEYPEVADFRW